MDAREVIEWRLAVQHLSGEPTSIAGYVHEALAVQSQDPGTARWSVGMRTGANDAQVRAAIDAGEILRTHMLRPTWHFVHRDDLRWLQRLTGGKVASSMPARHRQLGIDSGLIDRAFAIVQEELAGGVHLTRKQLAPLLPSTDAPRGQVTGHLLMLAELHGLICSGPMVGTEHSYALTDEVLGHSGESFDADDATRELVRRFFEGHGPASARDLARWCTLTVTQIVSVVGDLGLNTVQVDGTQLWYSADVVEQAMANADRARRRAFLLPTFDEVFLSYLVPNFPRSCAHPSAETKTQFNVAGGGLVVVDGTDVGGWKRTLTRGRASVRIELDPGLDDQARRLVQAEADRLVDFTVN